jgi:hypothetical protein
MSDGIACDHNNQLQEPPGSPETRVLAYSRWDAAADKKLGPRWDVAHRARQFNLYGGVKVTTNEAMGKIQMPTLGPPRASSDLPPPVAHRTADAGWATKAMPETGERSWPERNCLSYSSSFNHFADILDCL